MVSVVSNPTTVWTRILVDTGRLVSWARRSGTDEQKEAVRQVLNALNELAPHFDFIPNPPNLAASLDRAPGEGPPSMPVQQYQQSPETQAYYDGQHARNSGALRESNPYNADTRRAQYDAWFAGFDY